MKKNYNYNQNSRRRFPLSEKLKQAEKIFALRRIERLTLKEIGKIYGITRERVRQILLWYKKYKDEK